MYLRDWNWEASRFCRIAALISTKWPCSLCWFDASLAFSAPLMLLSIHSWSNAETIYSYILLVLSTILTYPVEKLCFWQLVGLWIREIVGDPWWRRQDLNSYQWAKVYLPRGTTSWLRATRNQIVSRPMMTYLWVPWYCNPRHSWPLD